MGPTQVHDACPGRAAAKKLRRRGSGTEPWEEDGSLPVAPAAAECATGSKPLAGSSAREGRHRRRQDGGARAGGAAAVTGAGPAAARGHGPDGRQHQREASRSRPALGCVRPPPHFPGPLPAGHRSCTACGTLCHAARRGAAPLAHAHAARLAQQGLRLRTSAVPAAPPAPPRAGRGMHQAPSIELPNVAPQCVSHIALDLGGSLIKLVYFSPDGDDGAPHDHDAPQAPAPAAGQQGPPTSGATASAKGSSSVRAPLRPPSPNGRGGAVEDRAVGALSHRRTCQALSAACGAGAWVLCRAAALCKV